MTENIEEMNQETAGEAAADNGKPGLPQLLEEIKKPIPGDNPCGQDATYDDDFQRLKTEIDRIGTVGGKVDQEQAISAAKELQARGKQLGTADGSGSIMGSSGGVDYNLIVELSRKILTEKSKDLRAAGYLGIGLFKTRGIPGIADGIKAIKILTEEFWEGLYPAKHRLVARKNAIEFVLSRFAEYLEDSKPASDDGEQIAESLEQIKALSGQLMDLMADNAPVTSGLTKSLNEALARVPKPVEKQPAAPAGTPQDSAPGGMATPAGSAVSAPAGIPSEVQSVSQANEAIVKAAAFFRGQDRKNAVPYRLLRSLRWDALMNEPPNENGKTKIEPPQAQRRTYLQGLAQNSQWEKLLDEGEASFQQNPFHFWLDLQRLTIAALEGLGAEYSRPRVVVLQQTAVLINRLPNLSKLSFSDGTGFADPMTVSWLEETVLPVLGDGTASAGGFDFSRSVGGEDLSTQFAEAQVLLGGGDLPGALALLEAGFSMDSSRNARFRRRLYMAILCLKGNLVDMARVIMEELSEEVKSYSLEEWDPQLALEVWTNLHKCYEFLAGSAAPADKQMFQQKSTGIFEKICRLDVRYALSTLGQKPKSRPTHQTRPQNDGSSVAVETAVPTSEASDNAEKKSEESTA